MVCTFCEELLNPPWRSSTYNHLHATTPTEVFANFSLSLLDICTRDPLRARSPFSQAFQNLSIMLFNIKLALLFGLAATSIAAPLGAKKGGRLRGGDDANVDTKPSAVSSVPRHEIGVENDPSCPPTKRSIWDMIQQATAGKRPTRLPANGKVSDYRATTSIKPNPASQQ